MEIGTRNSKAERDMCQEIYSTINKQFKNNCYLDKNTYSYQVTVGERSWVKTTKEE
jgi:hypothetical protein